MQLLSPHEQQPDPWASIQTALHWSFTAVFHLILGVALGSIAAGQLRRHHLRWTWAAVVFVFVMLTRATLVGSTFTIAVASLVASVRARRRHRKDIDSGVDLAEIAAARYGPLDLLRSIQSTISAHLPSEPNGRLAAGEHGLTLGRDERGRSVAIPFDTHGSGRHTLVVGATGSGKTVTQTLIVMRAVERGMGAVVLDPKGDRFMREQLRRAAEMEDRKFLEWTPVGPSVYNPYACGSDTEIADKALAAERFTEPHYLRQAQRYLGHVVRTLRAAKSEVSFASIVEHLDPDRLKELACELSEDEECPTTAYVTSLKARQRSDLAGVRDRLAILAESDVGRWLDPRTPDAPHFDLEAAVRDRAIVYFNLEADSRPLLAQMLGAAIVQDLQSTVAALQGAPVATVVAIDEFSALAAERVVGLFARARSAGISLLLATQELSDLRLPGREMLLEQVLGNLTVVIAHRQVVPESAALIAGISGRHGVWKVSRRSDGVTTRTRIRESVLNPDRVAGLGQGWAAVIVLGGEASVRIARISMPARQTSTSEGAGAYAF